MVGPVVRAVTMSINHGFNTNLYGEPAYVMAREHGHDIDAADDIAARASLAEIYDMAWHEHVAGYAWEHCRWQAARGPR